MQYQNSKICVLFTVVKTYVTGLNACLGHIALYENIRGTHYAVMYFHTSIKSK